MEGQTPDGGSITLSFAELPLPFFSAKTFEEKISPGWTRIPMMRQSKDFLNAAKRAGLKYLVHLGACGGNDTRIAHYAWHQFLERYVEWCGFSFAHLRPEIFMQNLLGYGGEKYDKEGVIRH
jgi:hypothetical protein